MECTSSSSPLDVVGERMWSLKEKWAGSPLRRQGTLGAGAFETAESELVVSYFLERFESLRMSPKGDRYEAVGRGRLAEQVGRAVRGRRPITMVLPAFPAKSPNTVNKVLGDLPDWGEELGLARLEGFCADVEQVYGVRVEAVVFSDGRVFNDLLGIGSETVLRYKRALMEMAREAGHTHLRFDSLEDYTQTEDPIAELLERYECERVDVDAMIREDAGTAQLYCGFATVVGKDLEQRLAGLSKSQATREAKRVAKEMMRRNMAFSRLVDDAYPEAVRISIHAHNNEGPKYGVSLLPGVGAGAGAGAGVGADGKVTLPGTPWHNVVCRDRDGTVRFMPKGAVDESRYRMVWKYGRPWGYEERVEGEEEEEEEVTKAVEEEKEEEEEMERESKGDGKQGEEEEEEEEVRGVKDGWEGWERLGAKVRRLVKDGERPTEFGGVVVEVEREAGVRVGDVPSRELRRLTERHGTVVLRGFAAEKPLEEVAAGLGAVLEWPMAGKVLELRQEAGTKLVSQSTEALPMHWDGMFKRKGDGTYGDVPAFQLFRCVAEYPQPEDERHGRTLFVDTRRVLAGLGEETVSRLRGMRVAYTTPGNGMFGGEGLRHVSPVVVRHARTGEEVLRFHEPWGCSALQQVTVEVEGDDAEGREREWLCATLLPLLRDRERYCYAHRWVAGDYVLTDNLSQLHARTPVPLPGRVIHRVHFN